MNTRRFFGNRCHFKGTGSCRVFMHRSMEEADKQFNELRKQFKICAKNITTDKAGMYVDENVELTKEDLELPWED